MYIYVEMRNIYDRHPRTVQWLLSIRRRHGRRIKPGTIVYPARELTVRPV